MFFDLKKVGERAKIFNHYCLPILTVHPHSAFKRNNYLPELIKHMPPQYHYLSEGLSTVYINTVYLKFYEADNYRLYLNNGFVVSNKMVNNIPIITPFTSIGELEMVVLTHDGKLYSAPKDFNNHLQHTSFNQGGYVLFAGYWKVKEGLIELIHAESGHYEPSIISLQNFVRFLTFAQCNLLETEFIFVNRHLEISADTKEARVNREYIICTKSQLLGPKINIIQFPNPLSLANKLTRINQSFFFERQYNIHLSMSLNDFCPLQR